MIEKENLKTVNIADEKELEEFAKSISKNIKLGDVLLLSGELGVGKTTLASKIINSVSSKYQNVTSPTFNIVHLYDTNIGIIWHFDLYRIKTIQEIYELGVDEAMNDGISIIEWPSIIKNLCVKDKIITNWLKTKSINIDLINEYKHDQKRVIKIY